MTALLLVLVHVLRLMPLTVVRLGLGESGIAYVVSVTLGDVIVAGRLCLEDGGLTYEGIDDARSSGLERLQLDMTSIESGMALDRALESVIAERYATILIAAGIEASESGFREAAAPDPADA